MMQEVLSLKLEGAQAPFGLHVRPHVERNVRQHV